MSRESTGRRLRCAIYTRKSTEEGLDQDFNSLDAQHEACAAYVASQASLGWKLVPDRYDDGGISGGTMERPALQRLLTDIRENRVDVVVVYKIDRLTRSLSDFARIVDVFDAAEASFVSVTQQFNTTTSMGRLTLNVLLSFAQFEREVTAERIRDKIAASRKKGMWMGGTVPLGYQVENRKLVIDEAEAGIVRFLFERYLELKSVRALVAEANARRFPGREQASSDEGSIVAPRVFGRGNLYHLLANPLYVGKVRHRGELYEGEHSSIIDRTTFDAAQTLLKAQAPARRSSTNSSGLHLLSGILHDEAGDRLRSVHANKKGVRYRYYVSKKHVEERGAKGDGWRLPAHRLEAVVVHRIDRLFGDKVTLSTWLKELAPSASIADALDEADDLRKRYASADPHQKRAILRSFIRRIDLEAGALTLEIDRRVIIDRIAGSQGTNAEPQPDDRVRIACPIALRRRGVETRIVLPASSGATTQPDPALVDLVLRAHRYLAQLTDGEGKSLGEVARLNGTDLSEVSRILPLAFLAPKIVDDVISGRQPIELTAQRLLRIGDLPMRWNQQQDLLAG